MLNPDQKLWIDTLSRSAIDVHKARRIINVISTCIEKEIDDEHHIMSAKLPESGSRFEATICGENPVFCIRKKAILIFTLDDYVKQGNLTEKQFNNSYEEHTNSVYKV